MIETEPAELFTADRLYSFEEEFSWSPSGDEVTAGAPFGEWTVRGATVVRGTGGQVGFSTSRRKVTLTFEVDFEAGELDEIEVVHAGHRPRGLTLGWTSDPDALESAAHLDGEFVHHDRARYRFRLMGHRAWNGRIRQLTLTVKTDKERQFRIPRIVGFRRSVELDAPQLRERLARAWRVDFDDEWRNAWVAGSEEPLGWKVEVPGSACLEFGYGATGSWPGVVRYAVGVAAAGPDAPPLFEERVNWGLDPAGWRDARVDLSSFSGSTVELTFTAQVQGEKGARVDFPAWSDPRLVACGPGTDSSAGPPNLLFISLDTLRADRLSAYGYSRETSPHLDAWAARSAVLFRHAVAPASWTLPSHTTLFTGLDAHRHGVTLFSQVPAEATTLAELLRQRGYTTRAITGGGLMHPSFNLSQGFDSFRYFEGKSRRLEITEGVDAAIRWLERAPARPWFLFFHTYEVHTPYNVRRPYFDRFSRFEGLRLREGRAGPPLAADGFEYHTSIDRFHAKGPGAEKLDRDDVVELVNDVYDSGVAFADQETARLFEALEGLGLSERTVVIVTSDHGELLGEHGGLSSHSTLYDENLMVPLMIAAPGAAATGTVVERQVGGVDVMPTALELLGIEPPTGLDGVSLAPLIRGEELDGPAETWSHAGMNNRGISLRSGNRWKFLYNHSVWGPLPGRQRIERIGDRAPDGEDPDLGALGERVRRTLRTEAAGARVRLRNGGDEALTGWIRGDSISIYNIKSWDAEADEVWWYKPNTARFRLAEGRELHLLVEGVAFEPTEVAIGPESGYPDEMTVLRFEEARQGSVAGYELGAEGWTPIEGLDGETGVWVWWQGEFAPTVESAGDTDARLQEDLRALGYVE